MFLAPKGNLIKNPGFELGLAFWNAPKVLSYELYSNTAISGDAAHSGLASLSLGCIDPTVPAVVFQDVGVCPGKNYELDFAVFGAVPSANTLSAEVRWLDDDGDDIGPGLCLVVPRSTIGWGCASQSWTLHSGIAGPVPVGSRVARVSFTSGKGSASLLLDDVVFFELE